MQQIVVIDDEEIIRRGLVCLIEEEKSGYQVAGAFADGQEAIEFLLNCEVDIVITDINMPGMSGLELIRRLRELNKSHQFIILSGYDDFDYARQAMRYGVKEYLLKPINHEELYESIKRLTTTVEANKDRIAVAQMKDILSKNYKLSLNLEQLAKEVYLTPKYLSRMFKEETGITAEQFLLQVRIGEAKRMLKENREMKSYEIAEAVGYSDGAAFHKIFKKLVGITPREYRENCSINR